MRPVGFVGCEIDFAKQPILLLVSGLAFDMWRVIEWGGGDSPRLVVLEFAHHDIFVLFMCVCV